MIRPTSSLFERVESGKPILLAEISPPQSADAAVVREAANRCAGKFHAVGISDNRQRVAMSALAASSLVAAEGLEPILHLTTRDRNRIALISEILGAQALGIRNLLCTSGTHQTLGRFRAAKNVYDIDSIQLLQTVARLPNDCGLVGETRGVPELDEFCLGAVASPDADPLPLQIMRLEKKAQAGARYFVTQPVFDLERFGAWWQEVTRRGIEKKVAIVAGIQPLVGESLAEIRSGASRSKVPQSLLERIPAAANGADGRAAAVKIAVETVQQLSKFQGLRGFSISAEDDLDAALQVVEQSGVGSN